MRIPTYEQRLLPSQPRGPRQDAGAFTAGARQTEAMADALGRAGQQADDAAMRNARTEANRRFSGLVKEWEQQNNAWQSEFVGERHGEYMPAAQKWWTERSTKFYEGLDNATRALLEPEVSRFAIREQAAADAWSRRESRRFADFSFQQTAESESRAAVARLQNLPADQILAEVSAQRDAATIRANQHANLFGLPREWVENHVSGAVSKATSSAIDALARRGDFERAEQLLKMPGVATAVGEGYGKLAEGVADMRRASEAIAFSDSLRGKPLDEALAQSAEKYKTDPRGREMADRLIKQNAQIAEAVRKQRQSANMDEVVGMLTGFRQPDGKSMTIPQIMKARPELLRDLTDTDMRTLYAVEQGRIAALRQAAGGEKIKTDFATYAQLYSLTDEELLATPIEAFRDKLADAQYMELVKRKASVRRGTVEAADKAWKDATTNFVASLGLRKDKKTGDDVGRFMIRANEERNAYIQIHGKPPDAEETTRILNRLIAPGKAESDWFFRESPSFQRDPANRGAFRPGKPSDLTYGDLLVPVAKGQPPRATVEEIRAAVALARAGGVRRVLAPVEVLEIIEDERRKKRRPAPTPDFGALQIPELDPTRRPLLNQR